MARRTKKEDVTLFLHELGTVTNELSWTDDVNEYLEWHNNVIEQMVTKKKQTTMNSKKNLFCLSISPLVGKKREHGVAC